MARAIGALISQTRKNEVRDNSKGSNTKKAAQQSEDKGIKCGVSTVRYKHTEGAGIKLKGTISSRV